MSLPGTGKGDFFQFVFYMFLVAQKGREFSQTNSLSSAKTVRISSLRPSRRGIFAFLYKKRSVLLATLLLKPFIPALMDIILDTLGRL
jgi:hypothetical protein